MAAISKVTICNAALISIGAATINSFTEESKEAAACNALYDLLRRDTLSTHAWTFATRRQQLAQSTGIPLYQYSFKYRLPADWLELKQVWRDTDYKLEADGFILSNRNTCLVKYIFDNEDPSSWTPLFVSALISHVAWQLAYTFPRSALPVQEKQEEYEKRLNVAQVRDSQQFIADPLGQGAARFIGDRFGHF